MDYHRPAELAAYAPRLSPEPFGGDAMGRKLNTSSNYLTSRLLPAPSIHFRPFDQRSLGQRAAAQQGSSAARAHWPGSISSSRPSPFVPSISITPPNGQRTIYATEPRPPAHPYQDQQKWSTTNPAPRGPGQAAFAFAQYIMDTSVPAYPYRAAAAAPSQLPTPHRYTSSHTANAPPAHGPATPVPQPTVRSLRSRPSEQEPRAVVEHLRVPPASASAPTSSATAKVDDALLRQLAEAADAVSRQDEEKSKESSSEKQDEPVVEPVDDKPAMRTRARTRSQIVHQDIADGQESDIEMSDGEQEQETSHAGGEQSHETEHSEEEEEEEESEYIEEDDDEQDADYREDGSGQPSKRTPKTVKARGTRSIARSKTHNSSAKRKSRSRRSVSSGSATFQLTPQSMLADGAWSVRPGERRRRGEAPFPGTNTPGLPTVEQFAEMPSKRARGRLPPTPNDLALPSDADPNHVADPTEEQIEYAGLTKFGKPVSWHGWRRRGISS